jgi:thiamine-monophosphate kinase
LTTEFELIEKFFSPPPHHTRLAGGDDAALLDVAAGMALAVSTDMLVEGTHFFAESDPRRLGHKALAVNLSDLAAMGALPRWATLSLSLPRVDEAWLAAFADGFLGLAREHDVDLVGGDTTRGPLNICVQIMGEIDATQALRRDGARRGDTIWVSGTLGDAALALRALRAQHARQVETHSSDTDWEYLIDRLDRPTPRVALGRKLVGQASAAIDISDGLLADLGHVCRRSQVGAVIQASKLPRSAAFVRHADNAVAHQLQLAGGDDYELCFTAPAAAQARVLELADEAGVTVASIGEIVSGRAVIAVDASGAEIRLARKGFDHFE